MEPWTQYELRRDQISAIMDSGLYVLFLFVIVIMIIKNNHIDNIIIHIDKHNNNNSIAILFLREHL